MEKNFTIVDKLGLHARPCSVLVSTAGKFSCEVKIQKGSNKVDAKSILGLMSLGVKCNDTITLICTGADEAEAMSALEGVMASQKLI